MSRTAALVAMLLAFLWPGAGAMAERGAIGDPTKPTELNSASVAAQRVDRPRWQLQSTILSPERNAAVINGRKLHVGDAVDGGILVEIRADGVTLQVERRRVELSLGPRTAKIRKDAN